MTSTEKEELFQAFDLCASMNPDIVAQLSPRILELCNTLSDGYELLEEQTRDLLQRYIQLPVKQTERRAILRFFSILENSAVKFLDAPPQRQDEPDTHQSYALIPRNFYSSRTWLELLGKTEIPEQVTAAVDAARRRNEVVDTIFLHLFRILLKLDSTRANRFFLEWIDKGEGMLDPDIMRDMLRVWFEQDTLPSAIWQQVFFWAENQQIQRHWPEITRWADRVLRKHTFLSLVQQPDRPPQLNSLWMCQPFDNEERLLRWTKHTLARIGASIIQFRVHAEKDVKAFEDWELALMLTELRTINRLITPFMIGADILWNTPDGPLLFAMSIFGFTSEYLRIWHHSLTELCKKAVRRLFVIDLKLNRKHFDTIRKLSFGIEELYQRAISELDALTERFDSLEQREKVVNLLAPVYASYREEKIFPAEIRHRYWKSMRVFHEDMLANIFQDRYRSDIDQILPMLRILSTIFASCRRYLTLRRTPTTDTDEVLAYEQDFIFEMRQLRISIIRETIAQHSHIISDSS
ncbi:MAG: hypothetical protein D6820_17110 [Lentisphaerae bacterium]|nr:MAG: hypothetical protein D6820_17110 [Lentisphaerota bacterium]